MDSSNFLGDTQNFLRAKFPSGLVPQSELLKHGVLRVSSSTLRRARKKGTLKAIKLGGEVTYTVASLCDWLESLESLEAGQKKQ